jgi:preprotein translocase subunit SecE
MKLKTYFQEAFNELFHKVSWPTWTELKDSTIIVMVASMIIALLVLAMDTSFQLIVIKLIYGVTNG